MPLTRTSGYLANSIPRHSSLNARPTSDAACECTLQKCGTRSQLQTLMPAASLQTDPRTSARMRLVRLRDTPAELAVRKWLWQNRLRFTTKNGDLPGSPDVANRSKRWAVFVHGCFWHGHENCKRATKPKRNAEFWKNKFANNKRRDAAKARALQERGFKVITVWECEVRKLARSNTRPPRALVNLVRALSRGNTRYL